MAIQVRRGLKKEFDPYKMLPGEWAVSIDAQTQNQMVWMCFAAGVVKRMGTYEDFKEQISEIAGDIIAQYTGEFDKIEQTIKQIAETTQEKADYVIQITGDITKVYFPQIQKYVEQAEKSANDAKESVLNASDFATEAESWAHGGTNTRLGENEDNSEYYSKQSKQYSEKAKDAAENSHFVLDEINKKLQFAEFSIDDNGNLIYTDNSPYNFVVENDGNLYWEVA